MAAITTDTFLDGGVARTAGETWTINGTTLTVRTDTRWHANAPAGMTGTLGQIVISSTLGGSYIVDATKVRWMPYNSGSGNVPSIGTTVTRGGVSGYLLGVWQTDLSLAPVAVGAAMPATGFLKFRDVTGGSFAPGALTGIGATATSADVLGWIEVVNDTSSTAIGIGSLGKMTTLGGWFSVGTTSGTRGQTMQLPAMGGGAGTHVYSVQVETSPGSGEFEWWFGQTTAHGWNTTNMSNTDMRAKYFESMGSGAIRFGSDGTTNMGAVPPAGCAVRVPNIFGRTALAASRATTVLPGVTQSTNRVGFSTQASYLSLQNIQTDWYINLSDFGYVNITESVVEGYNNYISNNVVPSTVTNTAFCTFSGGNTASPFGLQNTNAGVTITNVKSSAAPASSPGMLFARSSNFTCTNIEAIFYKTRTGTTQFPISLTQVSNATFTGVKVKGGSLNVSDSLNLRIRNVDYTDRIAGQVTSALAVNAIRISASASIVVDGFTFGDGGALINGQSYNMVFFASQNINDIKFRNAGTRRNPISSGDTPSLYPASIGETSLSGDNVSFQRLYFTGYRTVITAGINTASKTMANTLIEGVWTPQATAYLPIGTNTIVRGLGALPTASTTGANYGLHWSDFFTADDAGALLWQGQPPNSTTAGFNYIGAGSSVNATYTNNAVQLPVVGDTFYSEMQWFVKGHTGFQNLTPTVTGTSPANIALSFQIDNGSGWNGTWVPMTAANLSAQVLNPAGFKMKMRGVATAPNGVLTTVITRTTSTLDAQADNLYPLDVVTLSFEGLKPGSEVRAYVGTNPATAVPIGGTESSGETFSFTHSSSGADGYIAIFAMGYQPLFIPRTYAYADSSLLIQQVIDRNYFNPD